MKKLLLPVVLLFAVSGMLQSCDNGAYDMTPSVDKSNTHNPLNTRAPGGMGVMVATVNGKSWGAHATYLNYVNGLPYIYGDYQTEDGVISTLQKITLIFNNYHGLGLYYMNTDGSATWFIDSTTTTSTFGQIVVDSDMNGIMRGRFYFSGQDLNIANGTFRIIKY